jgi:hypothetical protein
MVPGLVVVDWLVLGFGFVGDRRGTIDHRKLGLGVGRIAVHRLVGGNRYEPSY